MIEAAILGRPVHTILLPEFHDSQEGTVHFHYLLDGAERAPACGAIARRACARSWRRRSKAATPIRSAAPDSCATFVRPRGLESPGNRRIRRGAGSAGRASRAGTDPGSALDSPDPARAAAVRQRGRGARAAHGRGITAAQRSSGSRNIVSARRRSSRRTASAAIDEHRRRKREAAGAVKRRAGRLVKVLFLVHNLGKTRHFEGVLDALTARGHSVVITAAHKRNKPLKLGHLQRQPAHRRRDEPGSPGRRLGTVRAAAPPGARLRAVPPSGLRATRRNWPSARGPMRRPAGPSGSPATARCGRRRAARQADAGAGRVARARASRTTSSSFESHAPDVILITPLIDFGSYQTDYVKSAHRLGIPIAFLPFSWDNLTNRGLVRIAPDRVLVWNEHQKQEAVTYHDVPPERVIVDRARRASTTSSRCVRRPHARNSAPATGLDASQPFLLYLCSSHFVAPDEVAFVRQWARAVRRASSRSATAASSCGRIPRTPSPGTASISRRFRMRQSGRSRQRCRPILRSTTRSTTARPSLA